MTAVPARVKSVCPVCLKVIPAERRKTKKEGLQEEIRLHKTCPEHGEFSAVIWRGNPKLTQWSRPKEAVHPENPFPGRGLGCPFDCGHCAEHSQNPCAVLLEITAFCNMNCPICFASSNENIVGDTPKQMNKLDPNPSLENIKNRLAQAKASAPEAVLQLSGGEPTLRDDLAKIITLGREVGFNFIQINSNGLLLAEGKNGQSGLEYAKSLREAGLDAVFLQFDTLKPEKSLKIRGRDIVETKFRAIDNSIEAGLGVVLVPTLVPGINTDEVGDIIRFAFKMSPGVRGVHFQPVSQFGRHPFKPEEADLARITLPELMQDLEKQSEGTIKVEHFSPPGTEHEMCSFHATYSTKEGKLAFVKLVQEEGLGRGPGKAVCCVSTRWASAPPQSCCSEKINPFDQFLNDIKRHSFTISAMAFQDAHTLDLERLKGCCIACLAEDGRLVPFCAYNLTSVDGVSPHRLDNWDEWKNHLHKSEA